MTGNNSHKKKARELQARTGMSYTRALREVAQGQGPTAQSSRLRPLPLGRTPDGATLTLDLEDAHAGGAGPHTLVVGTTGSGKSTLLQTLTSGLCTLHSPDEVHVVLVRGKQYPSSSFARLANNPHFEAVSGDGALLGRLRGVLEERRAPSTVLIMDDCDNELHKEPEVGNTLLHLMRVGRGLGVHVVLAYQHLPAVLAYRLGDLAAQRIALRTTTQQESRDAIGTDDAALLPPEPVLGLYVSGPGERPVLFTSVKTPS
jgi:S-DNA-T family DNA segregation ATPase FtsK/SpoIIIE